jgi:hypothetical protein
VHALRIDRDGNLWLGTEGSGAGRIDARNGGIEWFNKGHGLAAESPYSLALDASERLWAATEAGLFVAQLPEKQFRRVAEVPPVRCWVVAAGPGGQILTGGAGGLFRLSDRAGGATSRRPTAWSTMSFWRQPPSSPDEIWVGYWFSGRVTRIRIDGERLSMTHYGREQGLRGEMSYFLGFDADRPALVGIGPRRACLEWRALDSIRPGRRSDLERLRPGRLCGGARWHSLDRHQWRPGAFSAKPDGACRAASHGRIHKSRSGRPRGRGRPLRLDRSPIKLPDGAILGADFRPRRHSILFRYRLEPLFGDWRETPLHEMQFPGLPPNDYRLEVEARDGGGHGANSRRCSLLNPAAVVARLVVLRLGRHRRREDWFERCGAGDCCN